MRVLFYVEPWVELANPNFRLATIRHSLTPLAKILRDFGWTVGFLANKSLLEECALGGIELTQFELLPLETRQLVKISPSALNFSCKAQNNLLSTEELSHVEDIIGKRVSDWETDFIISWESPCYFLTSQTKFGKIVHLTPGAFCRPPYPETVTIDINGLFSRCEIASISETYCDATFQMPSAGEIDYFISLIASTIKIRKREGHKRILLPLQVSNYFAFNASCEFSDQYELLQYVAENLPSDFDLVVTQYTSKNINDTVLTADSYKKILRKYPNIIWDPSFDTLDSVSQYILPHVDGVISVSSSIGIQAVALGIPLFCIGKSHLNVYSCEYGTIADFANALGEKSSRLIPQKAKAALEAYFRNHLLSISWVRENPLDFCIFLERLIESNPREEIPHSNRPYLTQARISEAITRNERHLGAQKKLHSTIQSLLEFNRSASNKEIKAISLDVFDTLIERPAQFPAAVHWGVRDAIQSFVPADVFFSYVELRKAAESMAFSNAQQIGHEETTFDEIYACLQTLTGLDTETTSRIQSLEFAFEKKYLTPTQFGRIVYSLARNHEKKLVIASDMYLSENCLREILSNTGYDTAVAEFFVSSEFRAKKSTGSLFLCISKTLSIPIESILHLGDNVRADRDAPAKLGVKTILIPTRHVGFERNQWYKYLFATAPSEHSFGESVLAKIFSHHTKTQLTPSPTSDVADGNLRDFGFFALAPLLVGFCQWLFAQARLSNLTNLVFLSRDGMVIKQVFDRLFPYEKFGIASNYVYCSRRASRVAACVTKTDLIRLAYFPTGRVRLCDWALGRFGFRLTEAHESAVISVGIESSTSYVSQVDQPKLIALTHHIADDLLQSCERERSAYRKYLNSVGLDSTTHFGVVDVGYAGSMQLALSAILHNKNISGLYFLTREEAYVCDRSGLKTSGFFGEFENKRNAWHPFRRYSAIIECFLTCTDGSLDHFEDTVSANPIPIFDTLVDKNVRVKVFPAIWEGVSIFCSAFAEIVDPADKNCRLSKEACIFPLINVIEKPSPRTVRSFAGLIFEDSFGGQAPRYLIPPLGERGERFRKSPDFERRIIWKQGKMHWEKSFHIGRAKSPAPAKKDRGEVSKKSMEPPSALPLRTRIGAFALLRVGFMNSKKREKLRTKPALFFRDSKNPFLRLLS